MAALVDVRPVPSGATLLDVARAADLGYVEIVAANPGIDPWMPQSGAEIRLPALHIAPEGDAPLVVNLGDMRLYYTAPDGSRTSYPIGIGREGWELKSGTETRVAGKRRNPAWIPPASIRAEKPWLPERIPPGPDNPLGAYSLDLALSLVRIHGTNLPDGVGRRVSHGCIRMYPEDIEALFPRIAAGTRVLIVDQPAKLGWVEGELWLEVHPSQAQADAIEDGLPPPLEPVPGLEDSIRKVVGPALARVDWSTVSWAVESRLGIAVRITRPAAGQPVSLAP
ncbi:MAG: L,D-transpeptidase family protein [Solirubrobacterales bacterium]